MLGLFRRLWLPYYVRWQSSAQVQVQLRQLWHYYADKAKRKEPVDFRETGLRVFSSMEEDGILLWLIATLGITQGKFADIGGNDCVNSNCANLAFNLGWGGVFIDADERLIRRGKKIYARHPETAAADITFRGTVVTPDNVNALFSSDFPGADPDFLSIDIDGEDYFIWQSIREISPAIVLIEAVNECGMENRIERTSAKGYPAGASVVAMVQLAQSKGYRLVACNRAGFNLFFVKEHLQPDLIPSIKVEEVFALPSARAGWR